MPPSNTAPQPDPPTPSDGLSGPRDGPLETLRVLEIGDRGEIAGKLLADAGADVIRIEPPGGGRSRHVGPFVNDDPGQPSLLHAPVTPANAPSRSTSPSPPASRSGNGWSAASTS